MNHKLYTYFYPFFLFQEYKNNRYFHNLIPIASTAAIIVFSGTVGSAAKSMLRFK